MRAFPAFANRDRNPYNWLLYSALRARGVDVQEFDVAAANPRAAGSAETVLHVHWPEGNLNHRRWLRAASRSVGYLLAFRRARRNGARLVWTVHNLGSHERRYRRTEAMFWRAFLPLVDGWVALSKDARVAAIGRWPELAAKPSAVIPIGTYAGAHPDDVDMRTARQRLGLGDAARVLVFVGRVKAYKGVPGLVSEFRQVDDGRARLVIAGRIENDDLRAEIELASRGDDRVVVHDGVIPDDELQLFLRAADCVVAPFVDILNSSSVLLALAYDAPVLAPRIGSLPELQAEVGEEWLRLYDPPLTADHLYRALDAARPTQPPDLTSRSWSMIAEQTEVFYREVLGHTNASRR